MTKKLKGEFREPLAEKAEVLEMDYKRLKNRLNSPYIKILGIGGFGLIGLGAAFYINAAFNGGTVLIAAGGVATLVVNSLNQKWRKEFDLNQAEKAELQVQIDNDFRERQLQAEDRFRERQLSDAEANTRLRAIEVLSALIKSSNLSRDEKELCKQELQKLLSPVDEE